MSRLRVAVLVLLVVVVSVAAFSQAAGQRRACLPAPSGLTNWWPGDGNTSDIVGGQDAKFWGGDSYGAGLVDQAFAINPDRDGNFVYVPSEIAPSFGDGDFTICLWVNLDTNEGEHVLIEKYIQSDNPPEPGPGWTLTKLGTNEIGFSPGAVSDSSVLPILYGARYGEAAWTHFAVRRWGDRFTVFMNGRAISEGVEPGANLESVASLKFGHRGNAEDTPGSDDDRNFFLDGLIDEVQFYVGKALPNGTIRSIYQAGSAGVCKP